MREVLKVICVVGFMAASVAAAIAWTDTRPTQTTWWVRIACTSIALASIVAFLRLHFVSDLVPDYLHRRYRNYFNRGGFCFGVGAATVDGAFCLLIHFQNQRDRECVARLALRPRATSFIGPSSLDVVKVEVRCEPAAYGVATIPLALPTVVQGTRQPFDIGASVEHPSGRGRLLRFRPGVVVRTNANFRNPFHWLLAFASLLSGHIFLPQTARVDVPLPDRVATALLASRVPTVVTIWRLGDSPLPDAA